MSSNSINNTEGLKILLENAKQLSTTNSIGLRLCLQQTEKFIIDNFGKKSHFLEDLYRIKFSPYMYPHYYDFTAFESGKQQLLHLLKSIIKDKENSSNYQSLESLQPNQRENITYSKKESLQEIKVLIASPSDVVQERHLLLNNLETKFRREHFETRCNARLIVDGWEYLPSQTGYGQDIINADLVKQANIILAVFKHKLGTPTINYDNLQERSSSGTAEELLFAIRNKMLDNAPLGMAYFYYEAPVISLASVDFDNIKLEWDRLSKFKDEIQYEILYKTYKNENDLLALVCSDVCDNIIKYFK